MRFARIPLSLPPLALNLFTLRVQHELFHRNKYEPSLSFQSFPELAADFTPPDWVHGDTFSSVLRVTSSDVALWMHYDVFDNLLYQVQPHTLAHCPPPRARTHLFGSSSC